MGAQVTPWPLQGRARDDAPQRIKRPCDWELDLAIVQLETQLGTIEAYNRLVDRALIIRARIEQGDVQAQNPLYASNIKGEST